MDDLPVDVKILIVEQLISLLELDLKLKRFDRKKIKLAPYACISKAFNHIVEYHTFQELLVTSPALVEGSISTNRFKQMMARDGGRRKSNVRYLWFIASLEFPLRSTEAHTEYGSAANDKTFSQSLRDFWQILAEWPTTNKPLHLYLYHSRPIKELLAPDTTLWFEDAAFLNIIDVGSFPRIRCVSDVEAIRPQKYARTSDEIWRVWPVSLMHLLATMEGVSGISVDLYGLSTADPSLRQKYRQELGKIIHMLPKTCQRFEATCGWDTDNEPAILPLAADDFCIGLRNLSTQLRSLRLYGVKISPSLFWPSQNEDPSITTTLYWPKLKNFTLFFDRKDSYGKWFDLAEFERSKLPVGREAAIAGNLNELQVATGHAVCRMPALEGLYVSMFAPPTHDIPELQRWMAYKAGRRDANALVVIWDSEPDVKITELSDEALAAWNVKKEQLVVEGDRGSNTLRAIIDRV